MPRRSLGAVLTTLAVANYRSLRFVVLPLARLTVVTGANGTGKSSLYRSLRLLADVAQGRVVGSIAREGGMPSTLWAGDPRISAVRERAGANLQLGYAGDELGYQIDLGYPTFIERSGSTRSSRARSCSRVRSRARRRASCSGSARRCRPGTTAGGPTWGGSCAPATAC